MIAEPTAAQFEVNANYRTETRDLGHLDSLLQRIDGRGYRSYRDISGSYQFEGGQLSVDYVQGDPFAAPSRMRLRLPLKGAGIPTDLCETRIRRITVADYLARRVKRNIDQLERKGGSGKSGLISIDAGGQEVLERSALKVTHEWVEARLEVGLPAAGRRVLGYRAAEILCRDLPQLALSSLRLEDSIARELRQWVECVENQEAIRRELSRRDLVAFVGDGAILPRETGISQRPLRGEQVVPFESPDSLRVSFTLPNPASFAGQEGQEIVGMGLSKGVNLIAGGGYHGKSTLLRALEACVYPHVPGDGREYVVTDPNAVKIRAEDRRRIEKVDISAFINDLPNRQGTGEFSTDEASGSTSQAAAIVEAIEAGARTLLIDEDTSATNFMIRDARMQALVERADEPITPLVDRIRELSTSRGISTVLVMGGSGDYFDCADTVLVMRNFRSFDETAEAKEIASGIQTGRRSETVEGFPIVSRRAPRCSSINPVRRKGRVKIDCPAVDTIRFGFETIDLRAVEQLVERSQTRAVGYALHLMARRFRDRGMSLCRLLDGLEELLDEKGLEILNPHYRESPWGTEHPGNFSRPRRHEIAAALNRLRTLRISAKD